MESLDISGKTVEEAVQAALKQLGMTEEQVEITVLKRGKPGILGLGVEEARVLVTPKHKQDETIPASKPSSDTQNDNHAALAKVVLSNLLAAMEVPADVEIIPSTSLPVNAEPSPPSLNITGGDLGLLIGRRGQTLAALQYIVNLILFQKTGVSGHVIVDVEGYKQRRYIALESLALRLVEQVRKDRRPVVMEPMSPSERRIIHISLAHLADISTESTGEGESRKVVIGYKKPQSR